MKTDTLVDDIYALFNPNESHHVDEDNLSEFAEKIKSTVRKRLLEREEGKTAIRFSNLGKPDRQIWYQSKGEVPEELNAKTYLKFLYGDIIEEMLVFLIKESGHVVSDEQLEVNIDGVLGHIDCIIDGVVCDVKSAAPYSYQKFKNHTLYDDVFGKQYIDQLCGYSNVLTPGVAPMFLAFDKVAGDICTMPVSASIAVDHDPVKRIAHLKEVVKQAEPPPRCYPDEPDGVSGNRKLGTGCSYCAYKHRCWPGLRGFAYSNGPRWLTEVEKLPNVPEIDIPWK